MSQKCFVKCNSQMFCKLMSDLSHLWPFFLWNICCWNTTVRWLYLC